jgi:cytochrome c oxidase assembly factor CtaG
LYSVIALIGSLVYWNAIASIEAGNHKLSSAYLWYAMSQSPFIFPLCLYLLFASAILGFLFVYHLMQVVPTLTTTQEIIKSANDIYWSASASDRFSFWAALDFILTKPIKRSLIEFQAPVTKIQKFKNEEIK